MDLMLGDKLPWKSIQLLYDFGVIQVVMKFPAQCTGIFYLVFIFSELNDKERVKVLIFEALKLSQALGGLFLHIRNNVETKSGCSLFCGR